MTAGEVARTSRVAGDPVQIRHPDVHQDDVGPEPDRFPRRQRARHRPRRRPRSNRRSRAPAGDRPASGRRRRRGGRGSRAAPRMAVGRGYGTSRLRRAREVERPAEECRPLAHADDPVTVLDVRAAGGRVARRERRANRPRTSLLLRRARHRDGRRWSAPPGGCGTPPGRRPERAAAATGRGELDGEAGRAVALDQGREAGQAERGLDVPAVLRRQVALAKGADELVDLGQGLPRDLLDRLERRPRALRVALAEQPGRPCLDEDDVDRVTGRVVQVARDSRPLLGRRQPALASASRSARSARATSSACRRAAGAPVADDRRRPRRGRRTGAARSGRLVRDRGRADVDGEQAEHDGRGPPEPLAGALVRRGGERRRVRRSGRTAVQPRSRARSWGALAAVVTTKTPSGKRRC